MSLENILKKLMKYQQLSKSQRQKYLNEFEKK